MFTFFRDHNLNGKIIIPFTTHEGSSLASVVSDLEEQYPNANIKSPFSIAGHQVRGGAARIDAWLKFIGY